MEEARARHARAAEELLKKQHRSPANILNNALKRPNEPEDYHARPEETFKRLKYEFSRSLKKAMARE